jgi:hypothetical protein
VWRQDWGRRHGRVVLQREGEHCAIAGRKNYDGTDQALAFLKA